MCLGVGSGVSVPGKKQLKSTGSAIKFSRRGGKSKRTGRTQAKAKGS